MKRDAIRLSVAAAASWLVSFVLPFVALSRVVAAALALARGNESWRVQYLPDDGFYYLGLAKSFVATGTWSVDGGVSVTSGFHPLMAYSLVGLLALARPNDTQLVSQAIALSGVLALLGGGLLWLLARRLGGRLAAVYVVLLLASNNYTLNAVSFMDSSWVLLCSSALLLTWLSSERALASAAERPLPKRALALACLGFVGSLARTDFLLLPACLWLSVQTPAFYRRRWRGLSLAGSSGFFGALAGIAAVSVHARCTSGQWLQSSAVMKAHWAQVGGRNHMAALRLARELVGYPALGALGVLALGLLAARWLTPRPLEPPAARAPLTGVYGGAAALVGYVALYAQGPSTQPWYTSSLVVPLLCCAAALDAALPSLQQHTWPRVAAFAAAASLLVLASFKDYFVTSLPPPWPHQAALLQAGRVLAASHLPGRVAAFNSGIVGYYEGGHVINLDGLVNNDIYEYAKTNQLPKYLALKHIEHIVDFSRTLGEEQRRIQGGYDDLGFLMSMSIEKVFGDKYPYWGQLTLYRTNLGRGVTR